MTEFQLSTFKLVQDLQKRIEDANDPTVFTLNKELRALITQLDDIQACCDHMWCANVCQICGASREGDNA